ncbi:MAG: TRAP transporter substrate-binding protein [Pseudomonadota bacterium]
MKTFAAGLVTAALSLGACTGALAADVTLTVHHFLSPKSTAHTKLIMPWAERLESQSGGRIKVEVFPSMAMGGKPPELYRQVRDGAADAVWTLIGYTPGVFPRSEVFELPTVHRGSAEATTKAIQDRFDLIADDYDDIHPLLVHVHAGNALHMVGRSVTGPADLDGLKLRTPSRTGAWLIDAYGADPVGMPVPALPQALAKGVVDGALVPFEIVPPLKLHELTQNSVEGADGGRFGTSVFLFAMNKDRYEALPEDLKTVIDANAGAALAAQIGDAWDAAEAPGKALQEKSGGSVDGLSAETMAAFDAIGEQVAIRWAEEASANGLDGAALVEGAKAAVATASE